MQLKGQALFAPQPWAGKTSGVQTAPARGVSPPSWARGLAHPGGEEAGRGSERLDAKPVAVVAPWGPGRSPQFDAPTSGSALVSSPLAKISRAGACAAPLGVHTGRSRRSFFLTPAVLRCATQLVPENGVFS